MKKKWIALVAGTALAAGGCGTVCNLASQYPERYGGLSRDCQILGSAGSLGMPSGGGKGEALFVCAFLGICVTELSATALGDTLSLPLVDYLQLKKERKKALEPEHTQLPVQYSSTWDSPPPSRSKDAANRLPSLSASDEGGAPPEVGQGGRNEKPAPDDAPLPFDPVAPFKLVAPLGPSAPAEPLDCGPWKDPTPLFGTCSSTASKDDGGVKLLLPSGVNGTTGND